MKKSLVSLLLIILLTNPVFAVQKNIKMSKNTPKTNIQTKIDKNYYPAKQIDPKKVKYFKEYNMYRIEVHSEIEKNYLDEEIKTVTYYYTIPKYKAGVIAVEKITLEELLPKLSDSSQELLEKYINEVKQSFSQQSIPSLSADEETELRKYIIYECGLIKPTSFADKDNNFINEHYHKLIKNKVDYLLEIRKIQEESRKIGVCKYFEYADAIKYDELSLIINNNLYIPKSWFKNDMPYSFLRIRHKLYIRKCETKEINDEIREYQNALISLGKRDRQLVERGYLEIGMPQKVVQLIIGFPNETNTTEGIYGTSEQWVYYRDDSIVKCLYFDNGILTAIQDDN